MNSVWIVEEAGKPTCLGTCKSDGKILLQRSKEYHGGSPILRRYVPESKLAHLEAENRRLHRAVEWALSHYIDRAYGSAQDVVCNRDELARRARLRWNGKKWVAK